MIDKSFVEKIEQMSAVERFTIDGREYASKGLFAILPPHPTALEVSTLASLVKYVQDNPDDIDEAIICINGPRQVDVFSPFDEVWKSREVYLHAKDETPQFPFNSWVSVEDFIIRAQVHFDDDESRQALLKVVGNITESAVRTSEDDGVTQTVTAKAGIARVKEVEVQKITSLKVRRTFYEIGSIQGDFVLRLKSGREGMSPSCALFETAARIWEQEAIARIFKYVSAPEYPIKVTVIA